MQVLLARQIGFRSVRMRVGERMMKEKVERYENELERDGEAEGDEGERSMGREGDG